MSIFNDYYKKNKISIDNKYTYTFLDRLKNVCRMFKFYSYKPLNFKTYNSKSWNSKGWYYGIPDTISTPYTRLKGFLKLFNHNIIFAYKYTPEIIIYWEANKSRLSCQEKQLRAMDITGQSIIQPEEATCVLWHEDKSNDVLKTILDITNNKSESIKI